MMLEQKHAGAIEPRTEQTRHIDPGDHLSGDRVDPRDTVARVNVGQQLTADELELVQTLDRTLLIVNPKTPYLFKGFGVPDAEIG